MKEIENENGFEHIENKDAEVLQGFKPSLDDDTSLNQILVSLISDKKNISLKTELHNPKGLAILDMLSEYFKRKNWQTKTAPPPGLHNYQKKTIDRVYNQLLGLFPIVLKRFVRTLSMLLPEGESERRFRRLTKRVP